MRERSGAGILCVRIEQRARWTRGGAEGQRTEAARFLTALACCSPAGTRLRTGLFLADGAYRARDHSAAEAG